MPSGGVEPGLLPCELAGGAENTGRKKNSSHNVGIFGHRKNKVKLPSDQIKLFFSDRLNIRMLDLCTEYVQANSKYRVESDPESRCLYPERSRGILKMLPSILSGP